MNHHGRRLTHGISASPTNHHVIASCVCRADGVQFERGVRGSADRLGILAPLVNQAAARRGNVQSQVGPWTHRLICWLHGYRHGRCMDGDGLQPARAIARKVKHGEGSEDDFRLVCWCGILIGDGFEAASIPSLAPEGLELRQRDRTRHFRIGQVRNGTSVASLHRNGRG